MVGKSSKLNFTGCAYFRQRLALSLLSGKPIRISRIRCKGENVGCLPYEVDLFKFIDNLSKGTRVAIDESGTSVSFVPGILNGGTFQHVCNAGQPPGYYVEFCLMVAPFCKKPLRVKFSADAFACACHPSVDRIIRSAIKPLGKFTGDTFDLKRSPEGCGVSLECSRLTRLNPIGDWTDCGKVKRVRGVVYRSSRVPVSNLSRMIDTVKQTLLNMLPDVYLICETRSCPDPNPFFGLCLVAESTDRNCAYTSEASTLDDRDAGAEYSSPESIANTALSRLLREIYFGGVVDSVSQPLVILYMACNQPDLSRINAGRLTRSSVEMMRNLNRFFNLKFRMSFEKPDSCDGEEMNTGLTDRVIISCFGIGYENKFRSLV